MNFRFVKRERLERDLLIKLKNVILKELEILLLTISINNYCLVSMFFFVDFFKKTSCKFELFMWYHKLPDGLVLSCPNRCLCIIQFKPSSLGELEAIEYSESLSLNSRNNYDKFEPVQVWKLPCWWVDIAKLGG